MPPHVGVRRAQNLGAAVPILSLSKVVRTIPPNSAVVSMFGQNWPNHTAGADWSFTKDDLAGVLRFETRSGDRAYFDATTRDRSEVSGGPYPFDFDVDIWEQYHLLIEPGSSAGAGGQNPILGQWHDTPDETDQSGFPPPVAIFWNGSQLRWQWAWSTSNPYDGNFTAGNILLGPAIPNRWYNIVQRLRFGSSVDNSEADVWLDGEQKVAYRGKLGTINHIGCYTKKGIYRYTHTDPVAVRYILTKPTSEPLSGLIGVGPPRWRV